MRQLQSFSSTINLSLKSKNLFFKIRKTKFIIQLVCLLIKHQYFTGYKVIESGYLIVFFKLTLDCKRPLMITCKPGFNVPQHFKHSKKQWTSSSSILILSTTAGLMTHIEASQFKLGGRLLFKIT